MKILFIAKFNHPWDEEPIARAFEANGVTVIRAEEGRHTNKQLLGAVDEEKPDLVLWLKLKTKENPIFLIRELNQRHIPTVSWTFDLLIGHPNREQSVPLYPFLKADYNILTDGGHHETYKALGINTYTIKQGIPREYCYIGTEKPELKQDIIFVGGMNYVFPYRQRTMQFLMDTYGERFKWYGKEDTLEVRAHVLNDVVSSAKIVIGDSMFGDDYWSNRLYEMLGRGAFLIFPNVKGLEKEYMPYKHFVPYNWGDYKGLKEKIDYFLENDEQRNKIRLAGHEYTKNNYLWEHRVKQFLTLWENLSTT